MIFRQFSVCILGWYPHFSSYNLFISILTRDLLAILLLLNFVPRRPSLCSRAQYRTAFSFHSKNIALSAANRMGPSSGKSLRYPRPQLQPQPYDPVSLTHSLFNNLTFHLSTCPTSIIHQNNVNLIEPVLRQ